MGGHYESRFCWVRMLLIGLRLAGFAFCCLRVLSERWNCGYSGHCAIGSASHYGIKILLHSQFLHEIMRNCCFHCDYNTQKSRKIQEFEFLTIPETFESG